MFQRRWPKELAKERGSYLVRNLGTSDLLKARILRDQLVAEMNGEAFEYSQRDARRRELYLESSPEERELLDDLWSTEAETRWNRYRGPERGPTDHHRSPDERWSPKEDQEAVEWFETITGRTVPIEEYLDRWLSESDVVATTAAARRAAVDRFATWATQSGTKSIEAVDRRLAGRYVSHLMATGAANKTVNSHIGHLNVYWDWMLRRGIIETVSPWSKQQLSNKASQERLAWTPEECRLIVQEAPEGLLRDLATFGPLTGMRASEIAALGVSDVRDGFFFIHSGKTASARRRVPISSGLLEITERRTSGRPTGDRLLFPELRGLGKNLTKRFTRLLDRTFPERRAPGAQAQKTFHSYRHFANTEMLRAGHPEYIIKQILGHKRTDMTTGTHYHGATEDQLRAAIESIRLR